MPSLEEDDRLEREAGAKAPAPTESGGMVGANMTGGGQLGNPEITDDKLGNPGGPGPKILDRSDSEED